MTHAHRFAGTLHVLRAAGLRPTRQRLALARLLFEGGHRHVTAESLHQEAASGRVRVSLATVYNALNRFTKAGLLRAVVVDSQRSCFDTNTGEHQHVYFEESGELHDIPAESIKVLGVPDPPPGSAIRRIDVIVRIGRSERTTSAAAPRNPI